MGEPDSITDEGQTMVATLDRLARLVDGSGAGPAVPPAAIDSARAHALELLEVYGTSDGAAPLAVLDFAAELLCAIAVDLAAGRRKADELIDRIEATAGIPRLALGREALRAAQLGELPIDVAIEVELALLMTFAGARAVSLWTLWPSGDLKPISHAGDFQLEAQHTRHVARSLLGSQGSDFASDQSAVGIRIERLRPPGAALIARGPHRGADHRTVLLEAAAPVLAALLDRGALLAPDNPSEQAVMSSVDRRLARLRFDLHDGPQQDVHLLAQDLRLFREQLRPLIAEEPNADRLLGRLDDLDAQLVALDGDLRRLSTSVQSPFLQPGSLPDVLKQITDAFAGRTGVEPETRLSGDLGRLTDSQQITLLALIREALSNVREHSRASTVTITISSGPRGVDAQVTDDGCGFEPETTLVRAARAGRLGLVGMHERVRMLGGRTQIESRPGGPTVISATLPPWPSDDP
jgi:signal transduction histidine kinase